MLYRYDDDDVVADEGDNDDFEDYGVNAGIDIFFELMMTMMMMTLMMMIMMMMMMVIGDGDEDVDAGDNVHFKDYGGDGVNVGIDILSEKLA